MEAENVIREKAEELFKESDGRPFDTMVKLIFYAAKEWKDDGFREKVIFLSDVVIKLVKEDQSDKH